METRWYLFILVVFTISCLKITNGWQTSPSQYHIQTDEGPERYFRYQTDSGQYRKEKRLEDGTVIGTYAWIDDNGFLRQRDYIADNAGYRILKTKNVYVGRGVPVGEAVKAVKKVPAEAGTLVHQSPQRPVYTDLPLRRPVITDIPSTASYIPPSSTYSPVAPSTDIYLPPVVSTTTERPSLYKPAQSPFIQTSYLSSNTIESTTNSPIYASTASPFNVEISPNAAPSSTPSIISSTTPGYLEITQNSLIASSTEPPRYILPISNNSVYSTPSPLLEAPASVQYIPQTESPIYNIQNQNSLDFNPYVSQNDNNYVFHNGPTYPIDKRGQTYNGRLGNGYDPQYPTYDGVSVTNDGFRYYIPRAYHEEQTSGPSGERRDGSFGYIDPFGIRRVIYYNTAPGTGFQHRKNNRYVGFQATPYDPRPY